MTTTLTPGDSIYFLKSGIVVHKRLISPTDFASAMAPDATHVTRRGETATVTADLLAANPWLDDLDEQVRRFGEVVAEPGEFPSGAPRYTPGSAEEDIARDHAREIALAEPDEAKRVAALRDVRAKYGVASTQISQELAGSDGRFLRDR